MPKPSTEDKNLKVSWFGLLVGGYLLFTNGRRLILGWDGPVWWPWTAVLLATLMLGFEARKWLARRKAKNPALEEEESEDKPLRSLVFLLEEPRTIQPGAWIKQLGDALGTSLDSGRGDATEFLLPMPHPAISPDDGDCFMLKIPQGIFWIFHLRKPYIEDPEKFAEDIKDRRLRDIVAGHRAWISVDLLNWSGTEDRDQIYAVIGKALSALAGPDVLAICAPELGRCNEFTPALIERLAGGDPLSIFEDSTYAPVINIEAGDPAMVAAVEEARRRWPEFVAHFKKRDPAQDRPFIVKAPFGKDPNEEFMWVMVDAIDDDFVRGRLANQPHRILDLHEGQEVTLPVGSLTDWLCADEKDEPLGGWTQKVLAARNAGG